MNLAKQAELCATKTPNLAMGADPQTRERCATRNFENLTILPLPSVVESSREQAVYRHSLFPRDWDRRFQQIAVADHRVDLSLLQARRDKETTYPELTAGCKLVVLGIETGGRWAEEGCNSYDNSSWPKPGKFQHRQDAFLLRGNANRHNCCPQSVQPVSPRPLLEPVAQCDTVTQID